VPRLAGALEYNVPDRESSTLGTLFELAQNQGDAWQFTLNALDRFYEAVLSAPPGPNAPPGEHGTLVQRARQAPSDKVLDRAGAYIDRVRLLGLRTAELHVVLARLAGLVDLDKERERLTKELADLEQQIKRVTGLLNSPFAQKAPEAVVQKERDKLADLQASQTELSERLA
jgi:predicted trehalose synthase